MSTTQTIVTEIRRKSSGVFETPVKIGAEQRFVKSLLNSHNNNLEEQSILGLDCLTATWVDNDITYITKKFFNGDLSSVSSDGYYILFIEDYSNSHDNDEYYFKNQGLFIPEYDISKASFGPSKSLLLDDDNLYSFDGVNKQLKINPAFHLIERQILCLRKDISNTSDIQINSDILISEKDTGKRINDDGKILVKQSIINFL